MNTEKIRDIIKDTVNEIEDRRSDRPCLLSIRDIGHLCDIPMRTMKSYRDQGGMKKETVLGMEMIDVKSFRGWCLENLKGTRKAKTIGKLDAYINQYES